MKNPPRTWVDFIINEYWKTIFKESQYTALPSLQYYLMVHQDTALVEFYRRKDDSSTFEFNFIDQLNDKIEFPLFDTSITLEDIYEGIQFNSAEEEVKE